MFMNHATWFLAEAASVKRPKMAAEITSVWSDEEPVTFVALKHESNAKIITVISHHQYVT